MGFPALNFNVHLGCPLTVVFHLFSPPRERRTDNRSLLQTTATFAISQRLVFKEGLMSPSVTGRADTP